MVCEFLNQFYRSKLVEIATVEELESVGYARKSARRIKRTKLISVEKCEKLVKVLGDRASPVLVEALRDFIRQYLQLKKSTSTESGLKTDCWDPLN